MVTFYQSFFYVGMTTDPARRLREHNGLYANGKQGNPKGGKYTSKHRPWVARAYISYGSRSEALKAEYALKKGKRVRLDVIGLLKTLLCVGERVLIILGYQTQNGSLSFCFFISDMYKKPERLPAMILNLTKEEWALFDDAMKAWR